MKSDRKLPIALDIFLSTLKIGVTTFGGGYAMLPLMEKVFVERKKWLDKQEMIDILAVSQSAPGAIALNTSIFVGYRVFGFRGALAAALGISLPSFIILSVISVFYIQFKDNHIIEAALRGLRACVVALIFSAVLSLGKNALENVFGWAVAIASVLAALLLGINPVFIIIAAAAAGLIYGRLRMT